MNSASENDQSNKVAGINTEYLKADILKGLKRFWWIGLLIAAAVSVLLCYQARRNYEPVYQSSATFTVAISSEYGTSSYNVFETSGLAQTMPYIINSYALHNIVRRELGYTAAVEISVIEKTNLFSMTVTAYDPQQANNVLLSLIRNYPQIAELIVGGTELNMVDSTGENSTPINPLTYVAPIRNGCLVGGVILAALVALFVLTRSTIRDQDELKEILGVYCLGTIPGVYRKKRTNQNEIPLLITDSAHRHGYNEAIRLISGRFEKKSIGKVLMITSAVNGEGKSTMAANLALSLAESGRKVALIDCDLRKTTDAKMLNIEKNEPGLTNYLNGDDRLRVVKINVTEDSFLSFIPGGTRTDNASEMFSNPKLKPVIDSLRESMDYVILDSAPCGLLTDSVVLSEYADEILFVVRQDYASKDEVLSALSALSDSSTPIMGSVLNYVTRDGAYHYGYGNYGYHGYYYGRKYGYGYGSGYGYAQK